MSASRFRREYRCELASQVGVTKLSHRLRPLRPDGGFGVQTRQPRTGRKLIGNQTGCPAGQYDLFAVGQVAQPARVADDRIDVAALVAKRSVAGVYADVQPNRIRRLPL